jgi:hypothetical protein
MQEDERGHPITSDIDGLPEVEERPCPTCGMLFPGWKELITHAKRNHKDTDRGQSAVRQIPGVGITDGKVEEQELTWEQIDNILAHPIFWEKPTKIQIP